MTDTTTITVNSRPLQVVPHSSLLTSLLTAGIPVPHLCRHPDLEPPGRCSLCLVEVLDGDKWVVQHACRTSCDAGMVVRTESARLAKWLYLAASLLQRRGPFQNASVTELLNGLAPPPSSRPPLLTTTGAEDKQAGKQQGCILCGLCVSMCRKINRNRLTFLGRGPTLAIGYVGNGQECGHCRACRSVCPTGFIRETGEKAFQATLYPDPGPSTR